MTKRTIEIEDNLQEIIESGQEDLKNLCLEWLENNGDIDTEEPPDLGNDLDYSGSFHEICDSAVPIYTKEIEDLWYLYKSEFEEAYENAGCGDNPLENNGMAAIYFYISEQLSEWYQDNAADILNEWRKSKGFPEVEE